MVLCVLFLYIVEHAKLVNLFMSDDITIVCVPHNKITVLVDLNNNLIQISVCSLGQNA